MSEEWGPVQGFICPAFSLQPDSATVIAVLRAKSGLLFRSLELDAPLGRTIDWNDAVRASVGFPVFADIP